MRGVNNKVVLLSFLLLCVNLCVPERAERDNSLDLPDGEDRVDVNHKDIPAKSQQTLIKHDQEDGHDSIDPQKQGQSLRLEATTIYLSILLGVI